MVFALALLIRHYRQSRHHTERIRTSYVAAGMVIMLMASTTDYLPPLGLTIYPLGIIGNLAFCVLATVAMLRYGLLEIKVVVRKGIAYTLASMFILGVFGSLIFFLTYVIREVVSLLSISLTLIAVFTVAALFQPLFRRVQEVVDKGFFHDRYDHLQALKHFSREVRDIVDLRGLTTSLVTSIAQGMKSRGVYLLLPSPDTGDFTVDTYYGQKRGELFFSGKSDFIPVMAGQDDLIDVNGIDSSPFHAAVSRSEKESLVRNEIELILPLRVKRRLIGMLLLGTKLSDEYYSTEDRELLLFVARKVAPNVENALVYQNVQHERKQLQETMDGVMHALSSLVESRDAYTAGHQKRVSTLACAIARELGLSEWQVEGIRVSGLLHDIGKVAVPAEILSKPSKLSQSEFEIIKTHPQVACEILKEIEFPWPVVQTILQHHEKLDGSGYPAGLSGDEIILEARIICVADVVEAMASHRPYRPALGLELALQEIIRGRGMLYDPAAVDACLQVIRSKGFHFERPSVTVQA
jgi:putative nucleotidyltransferase with HDIG domain